MRNSTFLLILCVFFSCQRKDNEVDNQGLSYSVDTVIIDSKGRLLDLERGIFISGLDDKESSLFLYNRFDHSIDEINLNSLTFVNNYPLEAEGPNGTGNHVNYMNVSKDSLFFIKSFYKSGVFDRKGDVVERIDWERVANSASSQHEEKRWNEMMIDALDSKVFGLSYNNTKGEVFLDVLSVQDSLVNRHDIDPEKSYHNFILAVEEPRTFLDPLVYMNYENQLIFSHQYSSELILYDPEEEIVKTVYYEPSMTGKRVKDPRGPITTNEQVQHEYQHFLEQVRFSPPVWDGKNQRYFRLSAKRVFSDTREEGAFLPDMKEIKVFLTILDAKFNLVAETVIPELKSETAKYFAKDGKLWVYENFSDELGFIVVDI